jgi:3-hydroxyisobutyrate dehydrogenase-like beta-hydroxyacid dehydrogenase
MSDVSVLGLGVMGSAIARLLVERGHTVTVWNRTAARAAPLVQAGARLAPSATEAVQASSVIIVCVTDYSATYAALDGSDARGRTLVQLSTGSTNDARTAQAWVRERGGDYLDGAILATPRQMGTAASSILLSGSASAFATSRELLGHTAATLTYLGEQVSAASAFDLAFLSCLFGASVGFYHGLRLLESESASLDQFGALLEAAGPALTQMLRHDAGVVVAGDYREPEATLETCFLAVRLIQRQAREAGLDDALPSFLVDQFAAGMSAGHGNESAAALVKVMRARAPAKG